MDLTKCFCEGQGVQFLSGNGKGHSYGVIIQVNENCVDFALVNRIRLNTKCYDEEGAIRDLHQHNVRLRDCPPPFTTLYKYCDNGAYVFADMNNLQRFTEKDCLDSKLCVVDKGKKVSYFMMEEIRHHPWPTQAQKEYGNESVHKKLQKRRLPAVADALDDMEKDFGMEY